MNKQLYIKKQEYCLIKTGGSIKSFFDVFRYDMPNRQDEHGNGKQAHKEHSVMQVTDETT